MTDKEFKRLSRPQLIEIIYQLQLQTEALTAENQKLKESLEDKRIRMQQVGSIAEAAMGINNVMQAAQNAAQLYIDEVNSIRSEAENSGKLVLEEAELTRRRMLEETEATCQRMLKEAEQEAEAIMAQAQNYYRAYGSVVDAILEEYRNEHSDNG